MKPRNKFQAQIAQLSNELPQITQPQLDWAKKHCFDHIGRRTTKGIVTCLECAHEWHSSNERNKDLSNTTCPNCGNKLQIETTQKRVFKQTEYICIVTEHMGFQVLRFIYIDVYRKVGQKTHYYHSEVVQRWIAHNGKQAVLARLRPMGCFQDTWIFNSSLELRPDRELYDIFPTAVYPRQRLIPELKRSGFKGEFYDLSPFVLFQTLLTVNKAETLLKVKQTSLLKHFIRSHRRNIDFYWPSIRIAIRNGYIIKDASSWCDLIDLLNHFDKDIHNPKYICPKDLADTHDHYVQKRNKQREQEQQRVQQQKAIENEKQFRELKAKFFGISFSDGELQIRVLESVQDFLEEGTTMHHCVFTNNYYLRPDNLILSATIDGKRIETVEISLQTLQVIQSRGICNKNTEHHERIIKLVNKNKKLIRQRIAA